MFLLSLLTSTFVVVQSSQQCRSTHSVWGRYLKDHVMASENMKNIGMCYMQCSMNQRCKSINFHFGELLCELNDADRYTHPWDYVLKNDRAYSDYPVKVPFKEFVMTPLWLEKNAANISRNLSTTTDQMTFNAGSKDFELLLRVPLVAADVLEDGTPLTVEITVANDVSIGETSESDPNYGLSDGTDFIGFETVDQKNYATLTPCFGTQGSSGETKSFNEDFKGMAGLVPKGSFYPDQFVFVLELDKSWGSCSTAHGGGYTNTANYTKQLAPSHGLALEVYKGQKEERVGIKFIKVTVMKTDE